jgi:L-2-hydroxyglutarate oxidase LhgO
MEPELSQDIVGALWSPETGIVDSHAVMESLESDIVSLGGDLAYSSRVVRIDPSAEQGWVVQCFTDGSDGSPDSFLVRTVFNAAGLSAPLIVNAILPPKDQFTMYYARGSYASYKGPGASQISHLIYPCPAVGKSDQHNFQSLGTHLTLDLQGKIKFGPDIEWLQPPLADEDEQPSEFWTKHLVPDDSRLIEMHEAVTKYLPGVRLSGLTPDYVGFRPKIGPPQSGFQDFVFRVDGSPARPMISLLGIESPGLTSSLAIAEHVVDEIMGAKQNSI